MRVSKLTKLTSFSERSLLINVFRSVQDRPVLENQQMSLLIKLQCLNHNEANPAYISIYRFLRKNKNLLISVHICKFKPVICNVSNKKNKIKNKGSWIQSGWMHVKYDWNFVQPKQRITDLLINLKYHCTHYSSKTIYDKQYR